MDTVSKRYTDLELPGHPPGQKPEDVMWNASGSYSIKTVPAFWHEDVVYLYGVDLFNAHYFWEAHEVWERKWIFFKAHHESHAAWMQGMIQIAASFCKGVQNNPQGMQTNLEKGLDKIKQYIQEENIMGICPEDWATLLQVFAKIDHPVAQSQYPKIILQD